MLSTYAERSLTASISRKSRASVPGIARRVHVAPPSALLTIVPPAPLAHTTRSLAALAPHSRASTPLVCGIHRGVADAIAAIATTTITLVILTRGRERVLLDSQEIKRSRGAV